MNVSPDGLPANLVRLGSYLTQHEKPISTSTEEETKTEPVEGLLVDPRYVQATKKRMPATAYTTKPRPVFTFIQGGKADG